MTIPLQKDLDKKQELKESLIKSIGGKDALDAFREDTEKMLVVMSSLQLSDKKMCSILRSSVRKSWMQSPVRLLKLELARIADMNPDTRTKWLCECEHCNGKFKMTDVEVDHKSGEHPLLTLADIEKFARSILDVTIADLQVFCKSCHDIKTYAERYDMTFEEARIEKSVVAWQKTTKATKQSEFLTSVGFSASEISNNDKRRDAYRSYLNRGEQSGEFS